MCVCQLSQGIRFLHLAEQLIVFWQGIPIGLSIGLFKIVKEMAKDCYWFLAVAEVESASFFYIKRLLCLFILYLFISRATQYFYGVFAPMFANSPVFNKIGAVLENLLSSLRAELTLWNRPGENVTVADILNSNSALEEYIIVCSIASFLYHRTHTAWFN